MILLNGQPATTIDVLDRGLHYGDGLFETIAVVQSKPLLWERHMARLRHGCERLKIPAPDEPRLRTEVMQVAGGAPRCVVKILVTRGRGGRGYRPPHSVEPTRLVLGYPWPDYAQELWRSGVVTRLCATRLSRNPALAGVKHLNRMEQVLARAEWDDTAIFEGLMQDTEGNLVEGTMSNLFVLRGSCLLTPPIEQCGVAGIMRAEVIALAAHAGVKTEISTLSLADAKAADGLFLTNSLFGILPVRQFEECFYAITPLIDSLQRQLRQGHACA